MVSGFLLAPILPFSHYLYQHIHSGLEQIQKKKNVTKDLSMVLKPFGPTDFKMLKQKIGTKRLHEF